MGEDMVYEHRRGCLAVRAGDTYHFRFGVSAGQFDFADNGDILSPGSDNNGRVERNARTFHNLIGTEDQGFGVMPFLEWNLFGFQTFAVFGGNGSAVAQEYVHTFVFCEYGGSEAAFSGAKDYEAPLSVVCFHILTVII